MTMLAGCSALPYLDTEARPEPPGPVASHADADPATQVDLAGTGKTTPSHTGNPIKTAISLDADEEAPSATLYLPAMAEPPAAQAIAVAVDPERSHESTAPAFSDAAYPPPPPAMLAAADAHATAEASSEKAAQATPAAPSPVEEQAMAAAPAEDAPPRREEETAAQPDTVKPASPTNLADAAPEPPMPAAIAPAHAEPPAAATPAYNDITLARAEPLAVQAMPPMPMEEPAVAHKDAPVTAAMAEPAPKRHEFHAPAETAAASVLPLNETAALANAACGASCGAPYPMRPMEHWDIRENDRSLRDLFQAWGGKAGWQLSWELPMDFSLHSSASIAGDFETAVETVVTSMQGTEKPFKVIFYEGNRVMRVVGKGEQ